MVSSESSLSSWSDSEDKKRNKENNTSDEKEYDSEGNELYVVEQITDKRKQFDPKTKKMIWLYHLKWKGYSDKDMTWEPMHNLDCPDLLQDFERKYNQREKERQTQTQTHSAKKETHSDSHKKHKNKSYDSDTDLNKPSTSHISKRDLKSAQKKSKTDSIKKRTITSDSDDSDSSDRQRKKKLTKPGPKRVKEALMSKNSDKSSNNKRLDSDEINDKSFNKKKKPNSDSDSDSETIKKSKEGIVSDIEKRIMSKPGPKRAKEARLAKFKANETQKSSLDSDEESNDNIKKRNNNQLIDSDDEKTKRVLSKPGPKRAKEARIARLSAPKQTPVKDTDKSNEEKAKQSNDSDSDSQLSDKTSQFTKKDSLENDKKLLLSKPGPKRAKEARIAKLNNSSTPKTTQIEKSNEYEENDEKNRMNCDSFKVSNPSNEKRNNVLNYDSDSNKSDPNQSNNKSNKEVIDEKQRLLSKPGPKTAKEARIAKLSALNSSPKKTPIETNEEEDSLSVKESQQKESNTDSLITNEPSKQIINNDSKINDKSITESEDISDAQEEQRKKILSKPGPKRAKEARLKKIDESLKNSSILEENDNNLNTRTNSTDSLDAIISTPVPQEESIQMEQQLVTQISQNDNMTNGQPSDDPKPAPDSEMVDENQSSYIEALAKIGNYVNIETTLYTDDITNALSIQNGGIDMERPGFISKKLDIKQFARNNKTPEKIISAFYNDNTLCFLIKWLGDNKCDVVKAQQLNQSCPQMVIDFYQSKLRFS